MSRATPVGAMNSWLVPGDVRGYYTRHHGVCRNFGWPGPSQTAALPAWENQPGSSVISYSWAASRGGFIPQSWSDRFHRGVGLGALPFLLFPLTFLPLSLFVASPSLLGSPDPEPGRVFLSLCFSLFLCRGSQDLRAAQGPKVTLAGRCSIWLLEALWPW